LNATIVLEVISVICIRSHEILNTNSGSDSPASTAKYPAGEFSALPEGQNRAGASPAFS